MTVLFRCIRMQLRKKIYEVTDVGKVLMQHEIIRLKELHANAVKHEEEFQ